MAAIDFHSIDHFLEPNSFIIPLWKKYGTKQLMVTIDIHSMEKIWNQTVDGSHWFHWMGKKCMKVNGYRQLFGYTHILQNIFFCVQ